MIQVKAAKLLTGYCPRRLCADRVSNAWKPRRRGNSAKLPMVGRAHAARPRPNFQWLEESELQRSFRTSNGWKNLKSDNPLSEAGATRTRWESPTSVGEEPGGRGMWWPKARHGHARPAEQGASSAGGRAPGRSVPEPGGSFQPLEVSKEVPMVGTWNRVKAWRETATDTSLWSINSCSVNRVFEGRSWRSRAPKS